MGTRELGVIIPAYNEGATLERVLRRVLLQPCVQQVIVVDDCSSDRTAEIAQAFAADERVTFRRHPVNRGKGAAIRTGLADITAPIVIIQDADLEYDPNDFARLLEPIESGDSDVVYGSRSFGSHTAFSFWYVMGNRLVTLATNIIFDCCISDMRDLLQGHADGGGP